MTEEQTNDVVSDDQSVPTEPVTTTGESRTYTQEDVDRKMNNLIRQINDFKSKEAEREEAARKAEEQKAIKKGELEKVIQSKEDAIAELQSRLQARETESQIMRLESLLKSEGISDKMALVGWTTTYMSMDEKPDMNDWIAQQKEANPESFKPPKNVVSTGAVGTVKQIGYNDSLDARLKSDNPQVRLDAVRERAKKIALGEIPAPE